MKLSATRAEAHPAEDHAAVAACAEAPVKPVTILHIADALGVHKSTVSYALSGKGRASPQMRARILNFADELGYQPDPLAQRLAKRSKSRVVCPTGLCIANDYVALAFMVEMMRARAHPR